MQKKGRLPFVSCGLPVWALIVLFHFLPIPLFCQLNKADLPTQRLLLQLGSCYLNVARENQIDIDSGLVLASQRMHLNPALVIDEGLKGADLLAGATYSFRPAARANNIDSALFRLNRAKKAFLSAGDEGMLSRTLCYLGKTFLKKGDTAAAGGAFREAISRAARIGDLRGEALAWAFWGTYSAFQPATVTARIYRLKKADSLYSQVNDIRSRINLLSNIGYLSAALGQIDESQKNVAYALRLEDSIHFPYKHYTLDLLGLLSMIKGDHESAVKYAMDEVRVAETTGDSTALAYIYARRVVVDVAKNDNGAEALEWALKSLAEFKRRGEDLQSYRTVRNVVTIFIRQGKSEQAVSLLETLLKEHPPVDVMDRHEAYVVLGQSYINLANFDKSEYYLALAEQLQKQVSLTNGDIRSAELYFLLGQVYFNKRQFEKSRDYLNLALTYPNVMIPENEWADIQSYLAVIDSAAGHFKDAYAHTRRYEAMRDSLFKKNDSRLIGEMRAKYEVDKKDNNIKLLQQQAALQEARNRQNLFTRNVLIAGAVFLLVILSLLYNRFRLKQKTNRQLEIQKSEISGKNTVLQHLVKEKEWLLKEVHHRVKNNLHTVICLLESQARHLESDALQAIEISQHRIYAMSLIHQKLYQSIDLKVIDMSVYIPEFIRYLRNSFDNTGRIDFQLDVQPLWLDVGQAVPIALIVNETVTNSIKYAFPGEKRGIIGISMLKEGESITLTIADDGVGIDPALFDNPTDSLGLKLIRGLSEDIGARIHIGNDNGTVITIHFEAEFLKNNPTIVSLEKEEAFYA